MITANENLGMFSISTLRVFLATNLAAFLEKRKCHMLHTNFISPELERIMRKTQ